jgi:histidinol phosphatase-like PHP family hydrolase
VRSTFAGLSLHHPHGVTALGRLYRADFHIHTYLSDCGQPDATPEAMMAAAHAAGLEAMGFADHVIYPKDRVRPGTLRARVPPQYDGMRVYVGCEADVLSLTEVSIDRAFADSLDFVIMAGSHLNVDIASHPRGLTIAEEAAYIIEAMHACVDCGLADIIAHPFAVPAGPYGFAELAQAAEAEALLRLGEKAARAGVAIEYNPRELRRAPEAAGRIYQLFLQTGVKLAINSDAHRPGNVAFRGDRYATEEEMLAEGITEDRLWRIEDRRA